MRMVPMNRQWRLKGQQQPHKQWLPPDLGVYPRTLYMDPSIVVKLQRIFCTTLFSILVVHPPFFDRLEATTCLHGRRLFPRKEVPSSFSSHHYQLVCTSFSGATGDNPCTRAPKYVSSYLAHL